MASYGHCWVAVPVARVKIGHEALFPVKSFQIKNFDWVLLRLSVALIWPASKKKYQIVRHHKGAEHSRVRRNISYAYSNPGHFVEIQNLKIVQILIIEMFTKSILLLEKILVESKASKNQYWISYWNRLVSESRYWSKTLDLQLRPAHL